MKKYIFLLASFLLLSNIAIGQKSSNGKTPTDRTRLSPNLSIRKGTKPHQILMTGEDTTLRYFDADTVLRLGGAPDYYYATPVLTTTLDSLRIRTAEWSALAGAYITSPFGGQYINNIVNKKVSYQKINDSTWVYYQPDFGNDTIVAPAPTATAPYEEILYADLVSKMFASELVVGKKYLIADYKTTFYLNVTAILYTDANSEPLIVTALSPSQLHPIAFSPSNPRDIIYYDPSGVYVDGSTTGCITRRIETDRNINVPFDFRELRVQAGTWGEPDSYNSEVTYNRGDIVQSEGYLYISKQNSNYNVSIGQPEWWQNIGQTNAIFVVYAGFTFFNTSLTPNGNMVGPFPLFNLNDSRNFVIKNQPASYLNGLFLTFGCIKNSTFDALDNCYFGTEDDIINCKVGTLKNYSLKEGAFQNNTLGNVQGLITGNFQNNNFASGFNNNYLGTSTDNTIGENSTLNIINNYFSNNTIGRHFATNSIGQYCGNNSISNNFENNIIWNYFGDDDGAMRGNTVAQRFQNNYVYEACFSNNFGQNCRFNILGTNFKNNFVSANFTDNAIGENCQDNRFNAKFAGNSITFSFFNWTIDAECVGKFFGVDSPLDDIMNEVTKYVIYDASEVLKCMYYSSGTATFLTIPNI